VTDGIHIFTYGSLMFEPVIKAVIGRFPRAEQAIVRGYQCLRLRGQEFPALCPAIDGTHQTVGVLYSNISKVELERLDEFENDFYVRLPILAELNSGQLVRAEAYLISDHQCDLLDAEEWVAEEFLNNGLQQFLKKHHLHS